MSKINNLFLKNSYDDLKANYNKVLKGEEKCWDIVVLTASNDIQAKTYELQLSKRKKENLLPSNIDFFVIPDLNNERIGSGGATLNVLYKLNKKYDLSKKKVLIIHSGGDSKRIPQYSCLGKLFSPVPSELAYFKNSTLFDETMIIMSDFHRRMDYGVFIMCGDSLALFNPLQVDLQYKKAAVISMKMPKEIGTKHGVFVCDDNNIVTEFLHKQPLRVLEDKAVQNGYINFDTGMIYFNYEMVRELISLVNSKNNFELFVSSSSRLNIYGDFLYPFASNSTLEDYYKQGCEFEFNDNLKECRTILWNTFHKYQLSIIKLSPSLFLHFGTSKELLSIMTDNMEEYKYLDWKNKIASFYDEENDATMINSYIENSSTGKRNYFENSIIKDSKIGNNVIISNSSILNREIPCNVVLSSIMLNENKYVTRIYDINLNPKDELNSKTILFNNNNNCCALESEYGKSIWESNIYPIGRSIDESVDYALLLYRVLSGKATKEETKKYAILNKISLKDSFAESNTKKMLNEIFELERIILINKVYLILKQHGNLNKAKDLIESSPLKNEIIKMLKNNDDVDIKMRKYYLLYMLENSNDYLSKSFSSIGGNLKELAKNGNPIFAEDKIEIHNPVRINFGGGWSDTPPYCMENGGCVLNVSVKVNGCLPISVTIEKIKDKKLVFSCVDFSDETIIRSIKELRNCGNPNDSYALLKCAVIISNLVRKEDNNLNDLFNRIGTGIKITTSTIMIPRGSGLGTSSILSGTVLEAIYRFMGIKVSQEEICYDVLRLEQLMSTGGGWQDQIGGIIPGLKLITTDKGNEQLFNIEDVKISKDTKRELNKRLILINTAERRLARNLLRDIMGKYIAGDDVAKEIISSFQVIARQMKKSLEDGNINEFASLLNEHWELLKVLDKDCSNTCIEFIFESIKDLICGRFICGAGGGGFLLVVLKENVAKEQVDNRIKEVFSDIGVDAWEIEIV